MSRNEWGLFTIILAGIIVLFFIGAMFIPEDTTCLAYAELYRNVCQHLSDYSRQEIIDIFYSR